MDEAKLKKLFGKQIKKIRKSKGLTQEKLSEMAWIDPQHFCKMENGNHFPTLKTLINLANALNVNIEDLFSFENTAKDEKINRIIADLKKMDSDELKFFLETIHLYIKIRFDN